VTAALRPPRPCGRRGCACALCWPTVVRYLVGAKELTDEERAAIRVWKGEE
jgi:hypothetical protein